MDEKKFKIRSLQREMSVFKSFHEVRQSSLQLLFFLPKTPKSELFQSKICNFSTFPNYQTCGKVETFPLFRLSKLPKVWKSRNVSIFPNAKQKLNHPNTSKNHKFRRSPPTTSHRIHECNLSFSSMIEFQYFAFSYVVSVFFVIYYFQLFRCSPLYIGAHIEVRI